MIGSNEQGQGKRHHKQIELLAIAYVLLFSCFFHSLFFFFFLNLFFSLILLRYIFPAKSTQELTTKKFELNWIKDVVYAKSGLCSQMHAKLVGPETQFC